MALPTLNYTWQFNVNQAMLAQSTELNFSRTVMLALKNSLIGFATAPWTVVASSDNSSAALSDLWLNTGNLTWRAAGGGQTTSTGARSWILLRQTGMNSTFELLIDLLSEYSTQGHVATFTVCPDGFDTTTIAPGTIPAANSSRKVFKFNTQYAHNNGSTGPGKLHVEMTSTGEATRWAYCQSGDVVRGAAIEKPGGAAIWTPSIWNDPFIFMGPCNPTYGDLRDSSSNVKAYFEGALNSEFSMYLSSEGCASQGLGELMDYPDDDTGEWPILPIGLACTQTGARGPRRGTVLDMWWGADTLADGTNYPLSPNPTYEFAQVESLIWPWNGTPMEVF